MWATLFGQHRGPLFDQMRGAGPLYDQERGPSMARRGAPSLTMRQATYMPRRGAPSLAGRGGPSLAMRGAPVWRVEGAPFWPDQARGPLFDQSRAPEGNWRAIFMVIHGSLIKSTASDDNNKPIQFRFYSTKCPRKRVSASAGPPMRGPLRGAHCGRNGGNGF